VDVTAEQIGVLGSLTSDLGSLGTDEDGLGSGELREVDDGLVGWFV
jgi:hypothetical protein